MGTRIKLVIALVMGLIAALIVVMYLSAKEQEYAGRAAMVPVVVASGDIPQWTKLEEKHLAKMDIPEAYKQPGSFSFDKKDTILGQVCIAPVTKNEQILTTKLAEGREQSLASILANSGEKRTVTIGIAGEAGISGMLRPSDYVDIIGYFSYNVGGRKFDEMRYFEQNVLILALDQQTGYVPKIKSEQKPGQQESFSYSNATLAVSPENALKILLASKLGALYFTLRPAGDPHRVEAYDVMTAEKILGKGDPIWREADERRNFLPADFMSKFKPQ